MISRFASFAAILAAGMILADETITFNMPMDWGSTVAKMSESVDGTLVVQQKCMMTTARRLAIDPAKTYELSLQVKSGSATQVKVLLGFACYNKDGRFISCVNSQVVEGTDTVLAKDAKKGDTVLKVKDASKWENKGYYSIAINTKEDYSDLPNFDIVSSAIKEAVQEKKWWTVTLVKPLSKDIPAGTALRQMVNGGYLYTGGIGRPAAEFVSMKGTITGMAKSGYEPSVFPAGTEKVSVMILNNWDNAQTPVVYKDITLVIKDAAAPAGKEAETPQAANP